MTASLNRVNELRAAGVRMAARAVRLAPGLALLIALVSPQGIIPATAQTTASVTIRGVVHSVSTLTLVAQPESQSLDLEAGVPRAQVATVNERSNEAKGYVVTLASANARANGLSEAVLSGASSSANRVAYAIAYGPPGQETPVNLANGLATVTRATQKTAASGVWKSLVVTVPKASPPADTYSDTLTLTVQAN